MNAQETDAVLTGLMHQIDEALAEIAALTRQAFTRIYDNFLNGNYGEDAEVKDWRARCEELAEAARALAIRFDELVPNDEIVGRFGRDWHDRYKERHPINHETKLVEVSSPGFPGLPIRYLVPQDIMTYSRADALSDFDSPLLRTPVREAQFENYPNMQGDFLCAAFAPVINTLFWYIETHERKTL